MLRCGAGAAEQIPFANRAALLIRSFLRRRPVPLALQQPLREVRRAFAPQGRARRSCRRCQLSRDVDNEKARFDTQTEVHDLPAIAHCWSNQYLRPVPETFGFSNPEWFFGNVLERTFHDMPTHMLAVLRGKRDHGAGGSATRTWKHPTPAFCLRKPRATREPACIRGVDAHLSRPQAARNSL